MFGTLALSGLLFISVPDVIIIAGKFMASTIVSKFILTFELSGMRRQTSFTPIKAAFVSREQDVELIRLV